MVHESKLGERFSRQFAVCSGFSADHLIVNLTSAGKHTGKGNLQPEKIHPLFKTSVFLHNAFYVFVSKGRMSQHSCQARQASSPHRLLETGAHEERKEEEAFLKFPIGTLHLLSPSRVLLARSMKTSQTKSKRRLPCMAESGNIEKEKLLLPGNILYLLLPT